MGIVGRGLYPLEVPRGTLRRLGGHRGHSLPFLARRRRRRRQWMSSAAQSSNNGNEQPKVRVACVDLAILHWGETLRLQLGTGVMSGQVPYGDRTANWVGYCCAMRGSQSSAVHGPSSVVSGQRSAMPCHPRLCYAMLCYAFKCYALHNQCSPRAPGWPEQ
ncbi:hypothetical protein DM02DRAFT_348516 [Periconia macrospinosa]|uniref:Uncharacterized protein n=1 Tax=Periconia macrospinosa TaxID=97972 RepID=A0A2V1DSW2_9PLEO|nr:hypothetical protein DM02DRAFT_348516 [Periconia macrospinosa]